MDGKGAKWNNVFVERLWRSVKYGDIHLHAHETVDVKSTLGELFQLLKRADRTRASNTHTDSWATITAMIDPELPLLCAGRVFGENSTSRCGGLGYKLSAAFLIRISCWSRNANFCITAWYWR